MKRSMRLVLLAPVLALALTGCAVSSYCEGDQKYHKAESLPPLSGAEGVTLPESASALKIPPPPANPVAFGEHYKDADGDDAVRCLDKPPDMPPPVEPKPAETTAPAPATTPAPAPATKPAETPAPRG